MHGSPDIFGILGTNAWVTGAGRGIGLECVRTLKEQGVNVIGIDRETTPELRATADTCVELDVSDFKAVSKGVGVLSQAGKSPSILVNCAGITRDAMLWKMEEGQWDDVLDVNLKGAFNMTRHVLPLMREAGKSASIINIASINGLRGKAGQSNYAASKAGLIGLTKSAAHECGRFGVRVNAVAPGWVDTEMTAKIPPEYRAAALTQAVLGKLATTRDIANAVLFLASPLAGHITGCVLKVDGGQYI